MQDKRRQVHPIPVGKNPFRLMFGGKSQEAIPFLAGTIDFAAKIEQVEIEHLLIHPEQMSKALIDTKKIIGTDAILVPVTGSFPVFHGVPLQRNELFSNNITQNMLVVIRHLKAAREYVVCSIEGPLGMAQKVLGEQGLSDQELLLETAKVLAQEISEFLRLVGETRPDVILVKEEQLPGWLSEDSIVDILEPIFASISYYNAEPVLSVLEISSFLLPKLAESVKGIMLTQNSLKQSSLDELSVLQRQTGVCIGLELPQEIYFSPSDWLKNFSQNIKENFKGRGVFAYSSIVSKDALIENLLMITQTLSTVI